MIFSKLSDGKSEVTLDRLHEDLGCGSMLSAWSALGPYTPIPSSPRWWKGVHSSDGFKNFNDLTIPR